MEYVIVTPHPTDLRNEIIQNVKDGEDKKESCIDTWEVQTASFRDKDGELFNEKVLVHNTSAWKEVGGIRLIVDKKGNSQIHARFFYWSNYAKENRNSSQELYLYGRLTELLLAHFNESIRSINITGISK